MYVVGLLALYAILVAPGSSILPAMGAAGFQGFPPQAWSLLVALFLVGLAPNSAKWLNVVEELLRRSVHAWFLVPDGIERTIALLEDSRYNPSASQLNFIHGDQRDRFRDDLNLPPENLKYRWARASILVTSLRAMLNGAAHPLRRAAFTPFQEDFYDSIVVAYNALKPDVQAFVIDPTVDDETEEKLGRFVDNLLRRIYAYISWGVRQQADSEWKVDRTLEELGFVVPDRAGGRHLFDIVVPAVLLVAGITMMFYLLTDAISVVVGTPAPSISKSIISALTSGIAASLMYGGAIAIALKRRSAQIEQKVWHERSWKCLIPIAIWAGLVTWGVIIVSTIYGSVWSGMEWSILPVKIVTALPWLLVGAVASVVLASRLSGDVRRIETSHRVRDAIFVAVAVGMAGAAAQLIQTCLLEAARDFGAMSAREVPSYRFVSIEGWVEFACGAVIGFMVPQACRANFVTPSDPNMARALEALVSHAKLAFRSKSAAEDWVFMPNNYLDGITPAEAIRDKTHATGVERLLEADAERRREEARIERSVPVVIDGGRGGDGYVVPTAQTDDRVRA
jgi:hypothetical protein